MAKLKVGGWRHLSNFNDERFDANGLSLASPETREPATHRGDYGIYGVFEQKLYRVKDDDDRGVGIFARATYSPSDRNLINLYADGGIEFIGLDDRRPHDKFGIAAGYARVSRAARALDGDFQRLFGPIWPKRDAETLLTAVYQYEVQAGLNLQPNIQFIHHPGGGATDPLGANIGKRLKDATVVGLRTVIKF